MTTLAANAGCILRLVTMGGYQTSFGSLCRFMDDELKLLYVAKYYQS